MNYRKNYQTQNVGWFILACITVVVLLIPMLCILSLVILQNLASYLIETLRRYIRMKVILVVAIAAVMLLVTTGCVKQEERHFIGKEEIGHFVSSEGITSEYGYPKAKVVTTEGVFYVRTLMSARNGERVWIEEYSDRTKFVCTPSNHRCYGLVAN